MDKTYVAQKHWNQICIRICIHDPYANLPSRYTVTTQSDDVDIQIVCPYFFQVEKIFCHSPWATRLKNDPQSVMDKALNILRGVGQNQEKVFLCIATRVVVGLQAYLIYRTAHMKHALS